MLSETERYPELAALMAREVQLSEGKGATEEALELMVRLGRLKLSRLGDPRGALTLYQEVLRRKPAHAGAVGALEEMARSDNPLKGEAAGTLEPVFANEGEHLKLVQMLESRVESEANPVERVALLRKIAEVYANQMDNAEMAFVAAARALRELPDDPGTLEAAVGLFQKADAHDEMMALLGEVAPRAVDRRGPRQPLPGAGPAAGAERRDRRGGGELEAGAGDRPRRPRGARDGRPAARRGRAGCPSCSRC